MAVLVATLLNFIHWRIHGQKLLQLPPGWLGMISIAMMIGVPVMAVASLAGLISYKPFWLVMASDALLCDVYSIWHRQTANSDLPKGGTA